MNKYLIDTHYLIWIMKNPENINKKNSRYTKKL